MLFNSFEFLVFFPIVTILYFIFQHKYRWALLLVASCVFYMAFIPAYILVLFAIIIIDYYLGILIEKNIGYKKKLYLITSIVITCLILFIFKYFNFFVSSFNSIAKVLHWNYSIATLNIILPLGLSFHTFQSLSYVIEVYKEKQKAEYNFGIFALYVMFYPQLVAGPIERPQNMLPQFYEKHDFDYNRVVKGLRLMLWGFFKKVVIADRMSVLVNNIYDNPTAYKGLPLITATIFFSIQIYCDFSGYSDIAIGSAKVMGFNLIENFKRPYFSKSISEFWRRWHISLSSWLRDYIYIPLGGNRVKLGRNLFNLFITFLISGLWHGASWTFVIWGAIHGIYLIIGKLTKEGRERLLKTIHLNKHPMIIKVIRIGITYILVTFAWIFFRANSLQDAIYIISNGLDFNVIRSGNIYELLRTTLGGLGISKAEMVLLFVSMLFLISYEVLDRKECVFDRLSRKNVCIRWAYYFSVVLLIIFYGYFGAAQFIYFQF